MIDLFLSGLTNTTGPSHVRLIHLLLENNWLDTCEAHDVGISPPEDRGGTAGKVSEGESGEEQIDVIKQDFRS